MLTAGWAFPDETFFAFEGFKLEGLTFFRSGFPKPEIIGRDTDI